MNRKKMTYKKEDDKFFIKPSDKKFSNFKMSFLEIIKKFLPFKSDQMKLKSDIYNKCVLLIINDYTSSS